jgi:hypothetical protein
MNAVLGFAQLLERDPSMSEQARSKVSTILKSGGLILPGFSGQLVKQLYPTLS